MNYGILYNGFPAILEGYNDANWIFDSNEMKSTSGYLFTFHGDVVTWKSFKQMIITRSIVELKFMALKIVGSEIEWIRNFLYDIPLSTKPKHLISMHCDC